MGSMLDFLHRLHVRHERLKTSIHEGWRYPLPPWGRAVMGCLYFSLPVIGGWHVMQWAIGKSHASIGRNGEHLPVVGNPDSNHGHQQQLVGAGGWGGGVHLTASDEETQKRNRKMLQRFLRQQQKKLQQEEEAIENRNKNPVNSSTREAESSHENSA